MQVSTTYRTNAFDGDYALLSDGDSTMLITPHETYRLTRVSLQKRLLSQISPKTVEVKRGNATAYTVTFKGVELGQVRPLNGGWGWRTGRADHVCQDRQEAAQAFVSWLLRRHWSSYKHMFEVPAVCEP
jgi:hypothetical protein